MNYVSQHHTQRNSESKLLTISGQQKKKESQHIAAYVSLSCSIGSNTHHMLEPTLTLRISRLKIVTHAQL